MSTMRMLAMLVILILSARAPGSVVFTQAPNPAGGQYKSAWYPPDGLDGDEYAFDNFTLTASAGITEVHWRGAYTNYLQGAGRAPVFDFTISIYRSIPGGSQPDLGPGGRLAEYTVGGNAGETQAGTFGGVIMYDYAYTLPTPFQATAGTVYWIQIEASQGLTPVYYWPPDWSMAAGLGGNNSHFRIITGGPTQMISGDLAFTLYSTDAPTVTINASAAPVSAGVVSGAGAYPINSTVSLLATPNTGWGFVNWTENGSQVSGNAHYTFPATVDRTLVANFVQAYTISTGAFPTYGGTTSGDGVYNAGTMVTVTATPNHGFVFSGWSDGATEATHSFPAMGDVYLVAFFDSAPLAATFDFDNAPVHTSLPIDLTVDGLTAHFSATGQGFSIQPADTLGFTPAGFGGLCIYPNSVFPADLIVEFSQALVDFSIMYSPQELGCDDSATMRATAFMDGVQVGTATAVAPHPGTWPTGTLSISVPGGFNRVVVHYDSRPPTCQDWGPIFLADNMTVTRLCEQPAIGAQPVGATACVSADAAFAVTATGTQLGYRWQMETAFGSNVYADLSDGPAPGLGTVTGSDQATLVLSQVGPAGQHRVRCSLSNPCGQAVSDPAVLSVETCCPADFNHDGVVNSQDFFDFLNAFFAGLPGADFNQDSSINSQDFFDFLHAFFAGC